MLKIPKIKEYNPYILTFFVSLFFSYLAVSTDNLINHDAVVFMDAAKAYIRGGVGASFNMYSWPFYSWLVAVVHKLLWFPHIEQSAHFINALFYAVTCILFIRIYAEITNHEGSLWIAVVLVLTFTGINSYRADIMRDIPYWCFYLAGFFCLLRYFRRPAWQTAIGWQLFMGLAFLARVEGLAIIVLGPLAMFLKHAPIKQRIIQTGALYGLYAVGLIIAAVALLISDVSSLDIPLGKLGKISHYLNIYELFDNAVRGLGELYRYEGLHIDKNYWVLAVVYMSGLLAYVSVRIVGCLSFPYFVVLCFGAFKKRIVLNEYNRIILYFIAFLFLFFCVYMIRGPVLTSRYTTSLVFMLLLLLGQIVERLLPAISSSRHRRQIVATIFIYLFITTADSLISTQGDSKNHVLQAGYWVKENVDRSIPVYSNYYKALYYTDRGRSRLDSMSFKRLLKRVRSNTLGNDVYIIVTVEQDETETYGKELDGLVSAGRMEHMAEFANDDNDRSVIYRLASPAP